MKVGKRRTRDDDKWTIFYALSVAKKKNEISKDVR